jgi:Tol biopolymer transport system component
VPMAKKKPKPTVVFSSTLKLVVDVNPDLPGSKSWKIKLQRKSGSKWRTVGTYRTQGAAETRAFKVKAGTYRVKVYARPGYRAVTTKAYRFTPTTPAPPPTTPTTPATPATPIPPDTTAPGVVTGLAVVGRTATSITLAWTNPPDADLAAVIVRRAVGGTAPATATDGVAVALPSPTATSVSDTGLAVDTLYAFAVFTRDVTGNTSAGVPLATRTVGPSVVAITRVSVRSDGGQATGGHSEDPSISANGQWIAFDSSAANLVDNDTNGMPDVFVYDRDTGLTRRVSVRSDGGQATGVSEDPSISANGRWITYTSSAANLVDGDTDGRDDVFLFDQDTGITQRVSVRSDGEQATGENGSWYPAISADGRWITYSSYSANLIDDDTNGETDVFLFDRDTGRTRRVSVRSDGGQATGSSYISAISADGRWITYASQAGNLVDNDTNGLWDVFLFDQDTGLTQLVSVRSDGGNTTLNSEDPAISADGRWITYTSYAENLVDGDTNDMCDVFLFDRDTGLTRRVSVRSDGGQATRVVIDPDNDYLSFNPAISADGRWITYTSLAENLVDDDTNLDLDVFLFDRDTSTTQRISVRSDGGQAAGSYGSAISANGRWIAYDSPADNLVDADTNDHQDVFLTRMW